MKTINCIIFWIAITVVAHSQVIRIPADFPTIQQGIDATAQGDTVLVSPGTYKENINFNGRNIIVSSLFLTTQDTAYISQTIIDGNQAGSVVTFANNEDSTALLCGFNVVNGSSGCGGGIYCKNSSPVINHITVRDNHCSNGWIVGTGGGIGLDNASPVIQNVLITDNNAYGHGGGIYCIMSHPLLMDVRIINNTARGNGGGICMVQSSVILENVMISNDTSVRIPSSMQLYFGGRGGGIYASGSEWVLKNVSIHDNNAYYGGGLFNSASVPHFDDLDRCDIYKNTSIFGNDFFTDTPVHIIADTFSVTLPYQYHAFPINLFTFDILHGYYAQAASDLYVSPMGDDSNSGLSAADPLKTIHHAYSFILADSLHPRTIHLLEGTYSPGSNGDQFPVNVYSNINLEGSLPEQVYLFAEGNSRVLNIIEVSSAVISNMTLTGGWILGENGGGILCVSSHPVIENVVVSGNLAQSWNPGFVGPIGGYGGGLYMENADPVIRNSSIDNNQAWRTGGGVYCKTSGALMQGLVISDNSAYLEGGGLFIEDSLSILENLLIENNQVGDSIYGKGGGLSCSGSPVISNVTLAGNTAALGGGIYCSGSPAFSNLILTGNSAASGGGMFCSGAPIMKSITICNNVADHGGGIFFDAPGVVFDSNQRCNIYFNEADVGMDLYSNIFNEIILDTFTVLRPTSLHASIHDNFSFDIQNGKISQVNADLYISPDGNNDNSGLSTSEPLKNISDAITRIVADSQNSHTIFLMDGAYSPSATGEQLPVRLPGYVSLEGTSQSKVFIIGEGNPAVIELVNNTSSVISGIRITGGVNGIRCINSNPIIRDLRISNNSDIGIRCENSIPFLKNLVVSGNQGIGIGCKNSSVTIINTQVIDNVSIGISLSDSLNSLLDSVIVSGNGEGIVLSGGIYQLDHVRCSGNMGMGLNASSHLTIRNSDFSGNNHNGIYLHNSNALIENTFINGNHDNGIRIEYSELSFKNGMIQGNISPWAGGGIRCVSSDLALLQSTISGNVASAGGGIYSFTSYITLVNSIMWDDLPEEIVNYAHYGNTNSLTISYSNIKGGQDSIQTTHNTVHWLEGNINEAPLFITTGEFPFMLSISSSCRNAGTPDTTGLSLPLMDLAGGPRVWENRIDMGAYEWNNVGMDEDQSSKFKVQSYPNPTRGIVNFQFTVYNQESIILKVYNAQGQEVATVLEGRWPGDQVTRWDATSLPAGIYFYQLRSKGAGQLRNGKFVKF